MARRTRRAFTLVELLVVITIIGMLMGLLMPAVQAAREAGRRATCENNQHQIATAMLNFESTFRKFPSTQNKWGTNTVGWFVTLLADCDRPDLYSVWKAGNQGTAGSGPGYKFLALAFCPSDPPTSRGQSDTPMAYTANGLVLRNAANNLPAIGNDYISTSSPISATLLVSENLRVGSTYASSGTAGWTDYTQGYCTFGYPISGGSVPSAYSSWCASYSTLMSPATATTWPTTGANVASNHGGGVVAAFCDGHVSFLTSDIGNTAVTPGATVSSSVPSVFNAICAPDGVKYCSWPPVDESVIHP